MATKRRPTTLTSDRRSGPDPLNLRGTVRPARHTAGVGERDDRGRTRVVGVEADVTGLRRSDALLRLQASVLANIRGGIIVTDLSGRITHWNDGATQIFGYDASEMLGNSIFVIYGEPQDGQSGLSEAIAAGVDLVGERAGRRKDGQCVWVLAHTGLMRDDAGAPTGFIDTSTEITAAHAGEALLARLGAAVEYAGESVVITGLNGLIEYVNPAFERVSGYARAEVIGKKSSILHGGTKSRPSYKAMRKALAAGGHWAAEFTNRRKDGTTVVEHEVISPMLDSVGAITGYVAVKRDVTEERRLEDHARRQLRERVLVASAIRAMDARATPEATAEAICLQVASLSSLATAGLFIFEPNGRAASYGITVAGLPKPLLDPLSRTRTTYLRNHAREGAWTEAWHDQLQHPYNELFGRLGVKSTAYAPVRDGDKLIGLLFVSSALPEAIEPLATMLPALVEFADIAGALMGPHLAEQAATTRAQRRIRRVITDTAFHPVFQPIVEIESGQTVAFEALTRFTDGVAPDVRFAEAARLGMGAELELATLPASIAAAAGLPRGTWLNVNASPALVLAGGDLAAVLGRSDRALVVEVTEHEEVADYAAFKTALDGLDTPIRLAVDDIGAGYGSLHHLVKLQPAFVKLDRWLVAGIDGDPVRRSLVAGLGHFSAPTHCSIIAEGVETVAEHETLRGLGVRYGQGYLYGRPAAPHTFAGNGAGSATRAPRVARRTRRPRATRRETVIA